MVTSQLRLPVRAVRSSLQIRTRIGYRTKYLAGKAAGHCRLPFYLKK